MKKFIITETRPAIYTWHYEVEAENENEALEKVLEGLENPINTDVEACEYEDSDFKVEEA